MDLESDSNIDPASDREEEEQEKKERQVRRETFYEEKDNTLSEAFPDNFELMTRGFEPMLSTPKSIPEPSTSHHSMPESASSSRPHYPLCKIVRDISTSNIQEGKRVRKPSEKAKQQTYLVAINSSEDLQACYTAFAIDTQH